MRPMSDGWHALAWAARLLITLSVLTLNILGYVRYSRQNAA